MKSAAVSVSENVWYLTEVKLKCVSVHAGASSCLFVAITVCDATVDHYFDSVYVPCNGDNGTLTLQHIHSQTPRSLLTQQPESVRTCMNSLTSHIMLVTQQHRTRVQMHRIELVYLCKQSQRRRRSQMGALVHFEMTRTCARTQPNHWYSNVCAILDCEDVRHIAAWMAQLRQSNTKMYRVECVDDRCFQTWVCMRCNFKNKHRFFKAATYKMTATTTTPPHMTYIRNLCVVNDKNWQMHCEKCNHKHDLYLTPHAYLLPLQLSMTRFNKQCALPSSLNPCHGHGSSANKPTQKNMEALLGSFTLMSHVCIGAVLTQTHTETHTHTLMHDLCP